MSWFNIFLITLGAVVLLLLVVDANYNVFDSPNILEGKKDEKIKPKS